MSIKHFKEVNFMNFYGNEYIFNICNIFIRETSSIASEQSASIIEQFSLFTIDWYQLIDTCIGVLTLIGGAWCFVQIRTLKEKRIESMFSFLARLRIRLKILNNTLDENKDIILEKLYIPSERNRDAAERNNSYSEKLVDAFLKMCKETLQFFMETDNQVPLLQGWMEQYNTLIDFLDTYVRTEDKNYYKWDIDFEKNKTKFYELHSKNMKKMLKEIELYQLKLEKKISKKYIFVNAYEKLKTKILENKKRNR